MAELMNLWGELQSTNAAVAPRSLRPHRETYKERQASRLARGLHPMTALPLAHNGKQCRICVHLRNQAMTTKTDKTGMRALLAALAALAAPMDVEPRWEAKAGPVQERLEDALCDMLTMAWATPREERRLARRAATWGTTCDGAGHVVGAPRARSSARAAADGRISGMP